MVKKYLSLEEAARLLKIDPMELQRMRERGEIRAFADRGNWKFREDEVEELLRARQADSSPEVPIQHGDDLDESIFFEDDTDSDVKMTDGKASSLSDSGSDSDVRLVFDESLDGPGSSSEIKIPQLGDSDSDVRLGTPGKKKAADSEEGIDLDFGSDSNIRLDATDALEKKYPSESEEEIKIDFGSDSEIRLTTDDSSSDSDVKLVPTPSQKPDSDSDVKLADPNKKGPDSDSDVKLIDPNKPKKASDSDSDVKLTDPVVDQFQHSDSDVKLVTEAVDLFEEDSDSDVKLTGSMADFEVPKLGTPAVTPPAAPEEEEELEVELRGLDKGSDSDVKLFKGDEDEYNLLDVDAAPTWANENQPAVPQGAEPVAGKLPGDDEEEVSLEVDDSGIKLSQPADSGIALEADEVDEDSGIALDFGDSGITLAKDEDSGIALDLGADSGIALDSPADSGIALEDISDSGIPLDAPPKKGPGVSQERTQPLMNAYQGTGAESPEGTNMEVPLGADDAEEYAFSSDLEDTAENVTMFEESDLPVPTRKGGKGSMETSSEIDVSLYEVGTEDLPPDDDYAMELQGEHEAFADSAASEDVFGAADEDFQEGMQSGQSAADFSMPVIRKPAAEVEWGTGVFVGLALSSVVMVLTGWVVFDLVRTMWVADDPTVPTGMLLQSLKGIFG
ncbi:MAG: helix-turn-helix domain-containing protein [Planctomycetales bacterium]